MAGLKGANLALRFALELAMFAALAYGGWQLGAGQVWGVLAAVAAAIAATVVWGVFLSPKAHVPLPVPAAVALEGVLFVAAGLALLLGGHPLLGAALVALWGFNRLLIGVWRQSAADPQV